MRLTVISSKRHRGLQHSCPKVPGMKLVVERPQEKYGTAIFSKHEAIIDQTSLTDSDNVEILSVNLGSSSVPSVYKPPGSRFSFSEPETFNYQQINVFIGDDGTSKRLELSPIIG